MLRYSRQIDDTPKGEWQSSPVVVATHATILMRFRTDEKARGENGFKQKEEEGQTVSKIGINGKKKYANIPVNHHTKHY